MIRMFVRHTVSDFDAWKRGYDAFDETRRGLGVRDDAVFCGAQSQSEVTIWHDFDDMAAAQAFVDSEELAAAMASTEGTAVN